MGDCAPFFLVAYRAWVTEVDGKAFLCYDREKESTGGNTMSAYTGYLIRRERLAQNLSQEGLCKGICAVSYLSKIEQGLVEPGQEIIDRLFAALHIEFVRDRELEEEAERQLAQFFFLREADVPCEEARLFFKAYGQRLSRSEFALSYSVYRMCLEADRNDKDAVKTRFEKLKPFLACMPLRVRQEALFCLGRKTEDAREAAKIFEEAARLIPHCDILNAHASCMSYIGEYGKSRELTQKALSLAFEQGNVAVMIRCCLRLGGDACNRYEMDLAKHYFQRAMALERGRSMDIKKYVDYNLGSTYLELGCDEEAFSYLKQAEEDEWNDQHNLLLHQKLSILYAHRDDMEEARRQAALARSFLEKAEQLNTAGKHLYAAMVRFAELLTCKDAMDLPEYEQVLRTLYTQTKDTFGHGFMQFYGRYLVELLKRQRKYKEALSIQEEMSFPVQVK